jgi:tetratricopeptide (TPR) repeat protein
MAEERVFLSAVSSEFRSARKALTADFGARDVHVRVQEHFRPEPLVRTLLEALDDYIRTCAMVVCVIGRRSGDCPKPGEVAKVPGVLPGDVDRASYTQWEYYLVRHYGKPCLLYLARDDHTPDDPAPSGPDFPDLQRAFVARITGGGLHYVAFTTVDELCRKVGLHHWQPRGIAAIPDPRRPIRLPHASIGPDFKGRADFLAELHAGLQLGRDPKLAIVSRAVRGLGGIGKTCAAVEYAWAHRNAYNAVLFSTAESPDALQRGLAGLTGPLHLPEAVATEQKVQVQAVLDWLNANRDWLLILDNVDTQDALHAVRALAIGGGCLLITGRLSGFGGGIGILDLDLLDPDAATAMLLDRTSDRRMAADDAARARVLATQELDRLPLALEQAVAFIQHLGCGFADYQARLHATPEALLDRADLALTHYDRTVFRTWHASMAALTPPARALLELVAFLAADPVPDALLDVPVPGMPAADLREALADLVRYSLARREARLPGFSVHRLVQAVARRGLAAAGLERERLEQALGWVNAAFTGNPQDVRTWPVLDPLTPHAEAVVAHADAMGITGPASQLMTQVGLLFHAKAAYARAEPLYRRALAIDEASLGKDHPIVASRLNNLAALLRTTNRLGEAEPLYRRALAIDEASLGKDHPTVASILNNLALLLRATNRLGEAEPLFRRALAIDEANYGTDHPAVATRLNNLAALLRDTNRLGEAEPLYRRALALGEASLGRDHPNVASLLNNLALLLHDTNRLGEAEPLLRRALAIDEVSFGKDHPTVATDLNNLAGLLRATNRLGEAEPLLRRALATVEATLGADHPDVTPKIAWLAEVVQATGRLGEAEPLKRRVLAIFLAFERTTGYAHPNRDVAIKNYVGLLEAMGKSEPEIAAIIAAL